MHVQTRNRNTQEEQNWTPLELTGDTVAKNLPANAGHIRGVGSISGLGRSSGGGNGNPLQYSCLGKPHVQRSLVGYSSRGHKESVLT